MTLLKNSYFLSVLSLFLLNTQGSSAATIEKLEASVNSNLILLSDVSKFRETQTLRAQLDPLFSGTTVAARGPNATHEEIVQFLIDERMIMQAFPVTDSEVEQDINSILANNKIDRNVLKDTLKSQGYKYEDYFELIRISASKRNLIDRDIRTKVSISDDDIKSYFYTKLIRNTHSPKSYKLKFINLEVKNYKNAQTAMDVGKKAVSEIRGGEPFEEVAKRLAEDTSSQVSTDIQSFTEDQMSTFIKRAVSNLQVGQVSDVVGDPQSIFFIIKLVDIKSGEDERFERMKEEIRNQLAAAEYQHQISLWIDRQRSQTYIHLSGEPSVAGLPKQ